MGWGNTQLKTNKNSSPNDKILDWSKLKAFAEDKIKNEILKLVSERVENIVGKGENAGYQHFLLFPLCIQNASLSGSLKVGKELIKKDRRHDLNSVPNDKF